MALDPPLRKYEPEEETIPMEPESVILINAFEVPAGEDESFLRDWERARDYLSSQPGYIATRLHRSLSQDAAFRYVNVARWQSPGAFAAAIHSPGFTAATTTAHRHHPALYEVVSAEGEEIE
jgi:heme oxygenase (mycobilin-producing)